MFVTKNPVPTKMIFNGHTILLPNKIRETKASGNNILVMFESVGLPSEHFEKNLRCYSSSGVMLWEAQPPIRGIGNYKDTYMEFGNIIGDKVEVTTMQDFKYLVDIHTGELYRTDNVKFPQVTTAEELDQLVKQGKWPSKN